MFLKKLLINTSYTLLQGGLDVDVLGITIDSREVKKDFMFICIQGLKFDSHDFIDSVAKSGANVIVVSKDVSAPNNVTVIKVNDTRLAMSYIASNYYENPDKLMSFIGFTGTNGKTSCTFFMKQVLREHGKNVGLIGTVNTMINEQELPIKFKTSTTPDPLELMQILKIFSDNCEYVCMEVSSHSLLFNKVSCINFSVGVFTNLTQDHLDIHGTMENYFSEKAKLFNQCDYGVINVDDARGYDLIKLGKCNFLTYGIVNNADIRAFDIVYDSSKVNYKVKIDDNIHEFTVNIPGKFTVYNSLSVLSAALLLKIPIDTIKKAFSNMKGVPGRIQCVENNRGINVIVDYAHTPDGLFNIISSVREFTTGKIITVFGCGGDRDTAKRSVMGEIAGKLSDVCIITSDNPRTEDPDVIIDNIIEGTQKTNCEYLKFTDRKQAIFYAVKNAKANDSVIIAGKGHENYQIFSDRVIVFDDVLTAKQALEDVS